ncbi:MAG: hypothetical protein ACREHD_17810, partial [Pirellulales bacterium]
APATAIFKDRKSRFGTHTMRYSLRTLLVATTALVVWLGWQAERMHRQREANAVIDRAGGMVRYEDAFSWPVTKQLSTCLGRDAVQNVTAVYFGGTSATDDDLACLRMLPRLREVVLTSSAVTDAGLPHLHGLRDLETIDLRFTAVSESGIAALRRALPQARILSKSDLE